MNPNLFALPFLVKMKISKKEGHKNHYNSIIRDTAIKLLVGFSLLEKNMCVVFF